MMKKSLKNDMDIPLTLWTEPEVSSVGKTLEDALKMPGKKDAKKYQKGDDEDKEGYIITGTAYYKDLARGRLSGDLAGFLMCVAEYLPSSDEHKIIGFHVIGNGANELIQLGSVLLEAGATLEGLSRTSFAAVTLSCLYPLASDDALTNSPFSKRR